MNTLAKFTFAAALVGSAGVIGTTPASALPPISTGLATQAAPAPTTENVYYRCGRYRCHGYYRSYYRPYGGYYRPYRYGYGYGGYYRPHVGIGLGGLGIGIY